MSRFDTPLRLAALATALLIPAIPTMAQPPSPAAKSIVNPVLKVHPNNRRYFMLGNACEAIYLAGTNHSNNLQDWGSVYPPPAFNFAGTYPPADAPNANFIRGWHWEGSRYTDPNGSAWILPLPFARTGPGSANDGKPRFNLGQYDSSYVSRLQTRGSTAYSEGMVLSFMLFQGWSVEDYLLGGNFQIDVYPDHPFRLGNNTNGIDGDWSFDYSDGGELHSLIAGKPAAVSSAQDNYVRHIVQSLNGHENILWEVANESPGSLAWQNHIAQVIRNQEIALTKRHLVWISAPYRGASNLAVYNSAADVVSPTWQKPAVKADGTTVTGSPKPGSTYLQDPPVTSGDKVVILDTDHLDADCCWCDRTWVWKAFTRGYHVSLLEDDPSCPTNLANARKGINQTVAYSQKIRLVQMAPQSESQSTPCSTRYCLYTSDDPDPQPYAPAVPNGKEYLVFKPNTTNQVTIYSVPAGDYSGEWKNINTGNVSTVSVFAHPGGSLPLTSPYGTAPAALYLRRSGITFICS